MRKIRIEVVSGRYIVRLNSQLSILIGFGSTECEFEYGNHLADNPRIYHEWRKFTNYTFTVT